MKIGTKLSRILALALCVIICLASLPAYAFAAGGEWENPYADVSESDWYYSSVQFASERNLFDSAAQTEFFPDDAISRGAFVSALGRLSGDDIAGYTDSSFGDVPADADFMPYVAWAKAKGYVNGTSETTFSPEAPITREALAAVLFRYINSTGAFALREDYSLAYADSDDISLWAVQSVAELYNAAVYIGENGAEDEYFYPKQAVTRAEAAKTVESFDNYINNSIWKSAELIVMGFFESLISGEADRVEAFFTQEVLADLAALGGMRGVIDYIGEIAGISDPIISQQGGYYVCSVVLTAVGGSFDLTLVVGESELIEGLSITPKLQVEEPIQMPSGYTEAPVTVDAGEGFPLEGRVVLPDDTSKLVPIVVLIQGSGATDYDEIVGANRVFGQVACGLAERGIATLRYSKRNYSYPDIMAEKDYSVYDEYVRDVLAAVELAKQQPGIDPDKVFILGHSQGGMLAPLFLDEGAKAAGMILFAGSPRSLMDVLVDQQDMVMEYYAEVGMNEIIDQYRQIQEVWVSQRKELESMTAEEAMEAGTVYEMPAYYMYVLEQYNAIETIKKLEAPTLILQGSNDLQVYRDRDFVIYEDEVGSLPYVDTKLYDGLSHLFMPSLAANLIEAMDEYNEPAKIPSAVFDDIANWISSIG